MVRVGIIEQGPINYISRVMMGFAIVPKHYTSKFTAASCSFAATARLSCNVMFLINIELEARNAISI